MKQPPGLRRKIRGLLTASASLLHKDLRDSGLGGGLQASAALHAAGVPEHGVINAHPVKGPGAIFKIFPTRRFRKGFQESFSVHPVLEEGK